MFVHIPKTAGTSIEQHLGLFAEPRRGVQDHRTLRQIRRVMWPSRFESYFKFSFVRNSWERVASWYKNVLRDPEHRAKLRVPEGCSLREFLTEYGDVWGLQTQLHWIAGRRGTIPLDFIGRFENLEGDFSRVCEQIGVEDPFLPHTLKSDDPIHYVELYDDITRRIVAERYAKEIECFGFRFGQDARCRPNSPWSRFDLRRPRADARAREPV